MTRFATTIGLLLTLLALGCNKGASSNGGANEEKVLNLYTWSEYFPRPVLDEFTKRTGIKVNQTNFSTNEELISKLASGVVDYDVVVPSDYAVRILILDKRLAPLDRAKLTNFKNLDAKLLGQGYDKENQYSLPLYWGTTGIGVNKEQTKDPVDSWAVLFDPKNDQKISMLADARENFAVALKLMGKSVNETDPAVLEQAAERLRQQTKLVKSYDNDGFDDKLRTGEAALVQGFNGQLAKVVAENPQKFYYVVPKEGATHWIDNIAIRSGSKHTGNAHLFINYTLEPKVAADMVNQSRYASGNAAAKEFVKPEILNDKNIYPPDDVLKRCEVMDDIGKAAPLIDKLWTQIKAAK
jgi:spermidine/putrescine transport system substrate-binding protein